jgi:cyclic lactone autoinducer peptide
MKETMMKMVARVAEFACDLGMTTVCSGAYFQPETPKELK